jgi:hypothetical protein
MEVRLLGLYGRFRLFQKMPGAAEGVVADANPDRVLRAASSLTPEARATVGDAWMQTDPPGRRASRPSRHRGTGPRAATPPLRAGRRCAERRCRDRRRFHPRRPRPPHRAVARHRGRRGADPVTGDAPTVNGDDIDIPQPRSTFDRTLLSDPQSRPPSGCSGAGKGGPKAHPPGAAPFR